MDEIIGLMEVTEFPDIQTEYKKRSD